MGSDSIPENVHVYPRALETTTFSKLRHGACALPEPKQIGAIASAQRSLHEEILLHALAIVSHQLKLKSIRTWRFLFSVVC